MKSANRYYQDSKEIWVSTSIRDETSQILYRWEISTDFYIRLHSYRFYNISSSEKVSKWYKVSEEKVCELKEALYRIKVEQLNSNYYNPALNSGTSATLALAQEKLHELIFIDRNENGGYLEPTRLYNLRRMIREMNSNLLLNTGKYDTKLLGEDRKDDDQLQLIIILLVLIGAFISIMLLL